MNATLHIDDNSSMTLPPNKPQAFAKSFSADLGTPVALFHKLSKSEPFSFLFESTEGDARLARYSFLSTDPCLTVRFDKGQVTVATKNGAPHTEALANPIDYLRTRLADFRAQIEASINAGIDAGIDAGINSSADNDSAANRAFADFLQSHDNLPFLGGFVGYMGYGACGYTEKIPQQEKDVLAVPDGYYGLYDAVAIFDHQYRRVTILSLRGPDHVQELVDKLLSSDNLKPLPIDHSKLSKKEIFEDVTTSVDKKTYVNSVQRAQEFVKEGQAFQIVVAQRFSLLTTATPIDIYRMLQATNPSPYAYFLKFPEFVYLGSSPETFVQAQNGNLMLRAIAGTRRRGLDAAQDLLLAEELKSDEKEMAEHRMLVDLGRNDLGRISIAGTIRVGELACLTKYTHVMHLETEIRGKLSADHDMFDAFESCFPAGTVSGAPKIRAMQLLSELEPERRGVYSGAVGYFDWRGHMDGAIAIRSALIKEGVAHVNAGGGIVYDSQPELEFEESRNKAMGRLAGDQISREGRKMRLVIIDNYDSFTYNLYQMLQELMSEKIEVYRNDALSFDQLKKLAPDKIVLSPGPGHPSIASDFGICREIIVRHKELNCPTLGVCLGHQGIVQHLGGQVVRAPEVVHGKSSDIRIEADCPLFDGMAQVFPAMRYHSLVAEEAGFPEVLQIVARETRLGLIMALRHKTHPLYGVQFHPESIGTPSGTVMLKNFVEKC